MRTFGKILLYSAFLVSTLVLNLYHMAALAPPKVVDSPASARWIDKKDAGVHHLILEGAPYPRGVKAGALTKHLLLAQEDALVSQLKNWIPERWMFQLMVLGASLWFHGVEKFIEPTHLEEMYGTSLSAPREFDFLADGYTRQVAYHGLHEVGQMLVDRGVEGMGCTVGAAPRLGGWVLGRNFDFEGGRIFDTEKIVKWTYPERGYPFVSVVWAGMVGVVTGVNFKGLYGSINAAGSDHFRRIGTPSTLVLMKVLQEASNVEEAIRIITDARMFITDIFVLNDRDGNLVRVEKSPETTAVIRLNGPSVVANHLIAPEFSADQTNASRRSELTTEARQQRGERLARGLQEGMTAPQAVEEVLKILRDKGADRAGHPLPLGNRRAIDALIATHAVIYDGEREILYVSEGPALAGRFFGYDLKKSFAFKEPTLVDTLARDPRVDDETFYTLKHLNAEIHRAQGLIRDGRCADARNLLEGLDTRLREQSPYYFALGDAYKCVFEPERARQSWERALGLFPAYAREERELNRRLKE